jgi:hypothetical protein
MSTSGAVKPSCCKEKGSNATQSKLDACSIKRKPHKLKPDEPVTPVVHTATCLKAFDDGHNMKAAKALGITVPLALLGLADQVIE